MSTPYDYVLIDSRTGLTDIGGLCIGPLADRLVVVTGLNDQNIKGTLSFLKEAGIHPSSDAATPQPWDEADVTLDGEHAEPRLGPKPTLLVASPVPLGELAYKKVRIEELRKDLGVKPSFLSYHPQMALMETIFVRDYPEEYLSLKYRNLTDRMMAQVSDDVQHLLPQETPFHEDPSKILDTLQAILRAAPLEGELALQYLGLWDNALKADDPEEFWVKRQVASLFAQQPGFKLRALNNWGSALSAQARTRTGRGRR